MFLLSLPFSVASENPMVGFVGFVALLAGITLILCGIVVYSKAKREWNLYYNMRDQVDNPDVQRRMKDKKKGKIFLIVGILLVAVSLLIN